MNHKHNRSSRPFLRKAQSSKSPHWIWGRHAVEHALKNSKRRMVQLFVYQDYRERAETWVANHPNPPVVHTVSKSAIEGVLPKEAIHQGYALQCIPLNALDLEPFLRSQESAEKSLVLALDQVTDPHNVGAIWRSAAAFGVAGIMQTKRHAPQESGVLVKTACGGFDVCPQIRIHNLASGLEQLCNAGYNILGLTGDAKHSLYEYQPKPKQVLVLGAEGSGMRQRTHSCCHQLLRLPTKPPILDLNVSNATAIALFHLLG